MLQFVGSLLLLKDAFFSLSRFLLTDCVSNGNLHLVLALVCIRSVAFMRTLMKYSPFGVSVYICPEM